MAVGAYEQLPRHKAEIEKWEYNQTLTIVSFGLFSKFCLINVILSVRHVRLFECAQMSLDKDERTGRTSRARMGLTDRDNMAGTAVHMAPPTGRSVARLHFYPLPSAAQSPQRHFTTILTPVPNLFSNSTATIFIFTKYDSIGLIHFCNI